MKDDSDNITGLDPAEIFEEGRSIGQDESNDMFRDEIDQTIDRLVDEGGFSPEEAMAFFDPDPAPRRKGGRRKGKISCSPAQRRTMPQICKGSKSRSKSRPKRRYDPDPAPRRRGSRRRYDPATAGEYYQKVKRSPRTKGIMRKVTKFAMPGAAGISFYAAYVKRTDELKAAGTIVPDSVPPKIIDTVYEAIMYDIKNFNTSDAMTRIKNNVVQVSTPLVFGWGIKNFKVLGKYSVLAGNILNGIGVGTAAKVLLDPPIPVRANVSRGGCSPCNEHRSVVAQNRTQVHQAIQTAPVQAHHAQVQAAIQTQDNYIPWRE